MDHSDKSTDRYLAVSWQEFAIPGSVLFLEVTVSTAMLCHAITGKVSLRIWTAWNNGVMASTTE
jgi:hypothetical protein